ncbi:hypothetical protein [Pseudonocardia sp.]|uniref:hypothetical protein n=1 Tax=Pseudonocardia sp. TaxID=60912 RepID=UPI002620D4B5|nr:hypothetical protein [Pseudonocardia sp.]
MSTLRRVLVLGALTVIAVLLAGLSLLDPFHLRHASWFTAGTVLLAIVLATATLTVAVTIYVARVLVLMLGGTLALGWAVIAWLSIGLDEEGRSVSEVVSGGQRLVVLEGLERFSPDPVTWVVLRAGNGPFEQEAPVWQGLPEGGGPDTVAFRGSDELEIRSGTCVLVSRVEPVTLRVDPVHRASAAC